MSAVIAGMDTKTYEVPPFVAKAHSLVQWLRNSESRVRGTVLPVEIIDDLTRVECQLRTFGSTSSIPTDDKGSMSGIEDSGDGEMSDGDYRNDVLNSSNVCISGNIKGMLTISSMAQSMLRMSASIGGDAFLCVLCRLLRAALVSKCIGHLFIGLLYPYDC